MAKSTTKKDRSGGFFGGERHKTTISTGGFFNEKRATGYGKTSGESQKNAKKSRDKQGF